MMQSSLSPAMRLERLGPRDLVGPRSAQSLASVAALVMLIWTHAHDQWIAWPMGALWAAGLLLVAGIAAAAFSTKRRALGFVQPAAMVAALFVTIVGLSDTFYLWPTWPLWTVPLLLCLGLMVEPVAQLIRGGAPGGLAPPAAALTALFVLVVGLVSERWRAWPMGDVRLAALLLCLGLLAPRVAAGRASAKAAQLTATALAFFVLIVGLTDTYWYYPTWPIWTVTAVLALGLIAEPAAQLVSGRRIDRSVQTIVATAALFTLAAGLLSTHWHVWSMGSVRLAALLLCLGVVLGRLVEERAEYRFAQPAAMLGALVALVVGLSDTARLVPSWPLWLAIVLLVLGLAAQRLQEPAAGPRERVLSERVVELARTRRGALDVQATELRRIERDIHDGAQVRLVALSMKLGRAEDRYRDDPELSALLREAREDAGAAIRELRELARGIAPPVLADRGLEAAVRSLAQRSGSDVTVRGTLTHRLPPAVETAAYFVVAESLTNAAKHAAGARVEIQLDERGGDLFVEVTDFGPGGANPEGGGLTGLRQRAEALDGSLHITSPEGIGTQVEAVLPCGR